MSTNDTPHPQTRSAVAPALTPEQELSKALEQYSEKVVRTWVTRRNHGEMPQPDGFGVAASDCQDSIRIQLRVRGGQVVDARFVSEGCGATFACGSAAAELARGRSVEELLTVTPQDVLDELDGLPSHNEHCADVAAQALLRAAQDVLRTNNAPWKRLYR